MRNGQVWFEADPAAGTDGSAGPCAVDDGRFRRTLGAAQADKKHAEQNQSQPGELLLSQRLVEEDLCPDQAPHISERHHRVKHGKLPDRKSTRLTSSHGYISYAVFCLQKNSPH